MSEEKRETIPLSEAVTHLLEECRMVLPGVKALFGFQLIAVFNSRFAESLTANEQVLHLVAIGLVAIAVGLLMAPAAFHRQLGPKEATAGFITIASRFLLLSMPPLMLAICSDFYLIGRLILQSRILSFVLSLVLLALFSTLWFLLPRLKCMRTLASHKGDAPHTSGTRK